MRSIVIHGHFYQPPRDDPWTGTIPVEPNAAPFHDWNERIERECYAPVAPSLASLSFDFGPTLLEWTERHAPGTYRAVVAAGRAGGAVAAASPSSRMTARSRTTSRSGRWCAMRTPGLSGSLADRISWWRWPPTERPTVTITKAARSSWPACSTP